MTKDNSVAKLGSTCAILVGISYIVIAVAFFLIPPAQQPGIGYTGEYFRSVLDNYTVQTILFWTFALSSFLAIATVTAVSDLVRVLNEGWVRWTGTLATVGYAVLAITNLLSKDLIRQIAEGYVRVDSSSQATLEVIGNVYNDWMCFGMIGAWFLAVNWFALRSGRFSKALAWVGLVAGITYWLVVIGYVLDTPPLVNVAAGLAGIIIPVWYIWMGVILRKTSV